MTVWEFPKATVVRVLDGDTIQLDVDQGFNETHRGMFRLLGINARELHEPGGPEAKANLEALLPIGSVVSIMSVKDDKYGGRYLAQIYLPNTTVSISDTLITTGWAAHWNGKGPKPTPPWPRTEVTDVR